MSRSEEEGNDTEEKQEARKFDFSMAVQPIRRRLKKVGPTHSENAVQGTWRILEPETTSTNLRLSEADLAKAKARARKLWKPYQALSKDVTHRALS